MTGTAGALAIGAVLMAFTLGGCAGGSLSTREQFTYGGGALGAGTGAIIGAASGSAAVGAAIGGPIGAITGYLIGDSLQGGTPPSRQVGARHSDPKRHGSGHKRAPSLQKKSPADAATDKSRRDLPGGGGQVF